MIDSLFASFYLALSQSTTFHCDDDVVGWRRVVPLSRVDIIMVSHDVVGWRRSIYGHSYVKTNLS